LTCCKPRSNATSTSNNLCPLSGSPPTDCRVIRPLFATGSPLWTNGTSLKSKRPAKCG
jgi:hypothetical protein